MTRVLVSRASGMAKAWVHFSAMQSDEVEKHVAEVAQALHQRADELAVLLACAVARRSLSSPLMFGCPRRGAAPDRAHAERSRVNRADDVGGCLQ
jgi:hypothetical protein